MFSHIEQFLGHWLQALVRDHRSYVTVAIGCTGGQHRSVYLVEQLAAGLQRAAGSPSSATGSSTPRREPGRRRP